jgi:hypothetical protein
VTFAPDWRNQDAISSTLQNKTPHAGPELPSLESSAPDGAGFIFGRDTGCDNTGSVHPFDSQISLAIKTLDYELPGIAWQHPLRRAVASSLFRRG